MLTSGSFLAWPQRHLNDALSIFPCNSPLTVLKKMRFGLLPRLSSPTPPTHFFSISLTLLIHSDRFCKPFHSKSTLKIVPKGLNEMVYDNFAEERKTKNKKTKKEKEKRKKKRKKSQKQGFV